MFLEIEKEYTRKKKLMKHSTYRPNRNLNKMLVSSMLCLHAARASKLATAFGEDFVPSNSWMNRFKARYSICYTANMLWTMLQNVMKNQAKSMKSGNN